MRHPIAFGALVLCLLSLGACSWMNDGEGLLLDPSDDYLEVRQDPPLQVPDDLPALQDTDPFPIPPTPPARNPSFYPGKPPLPDAIYANDNRDEVRIQRLRDRRWLVVPEAPTTVWPKIKQFLGENGVTVTYDAPQTGRLNTEWLRIEDTTYRDVVRTLLRDAKQGAGLEQGMDRYLIRVEQGLRPFTTEIHTRHENDSLTLPVPDDLTNLNSMFSDVSQAEQDFLAEIGAYIAAKVAEQTVSKVALQIGSTQKAAVTRDSQGDPVLRLNLDYERAWATLGQALDNAAVEVASSDRDSGTFVVSLDDTAFGKEVRKGFLCRVTFSCDDRATRYDLVIQVSEASDSLFEVSVLDADTRQRAQPDIAQQVLVLLREYAS